MTTLTITVTNFAANVLMRKLEKDGVKVSVKKVRQPITVEEELRRMLNIICDYYHVDFELTQIHYRGRQVVQVKKVYAYLAKTHFPSIADKTLVSVIRLDRSTLTTHKLEIFDRLEGRTRNIPDNLMLLNDIKAISMLIN